MATEFGFVVVPEFQSIVIMVLILGVASSILIIKKKPLFSNWEFS